MMYEYKLMFWTVVWAIVLIGAIVGIFWKPAIYVVVVVSAILFGMFLYETIRYGRRK